MTLESVLMSALIEITILQDPFSVPRTKHVTAKIPLSWSNALAKRARARGNSLSAEFRIALAHYIEQERIEVVKPDC